MFFNNLESNARVRIIAFSCCCVFQNYTSSIKYMSSIILFLLLIFKCGSLQNLKKKDKRNASAIIFNGRTL